MKVAVTGASGFIGKNLRIFLTNAGFEFTAISRNTLHNPVELRNVIGKSDIVVNLAGARILTRWTKRRKKIIYDSRILTTRAVVDAIKESTNKPALLISASAVGIYPDQCIHDESRTEFSNDFLANICIDWEQEALKAADAGVRTVIFRQGIVLSKSGGALKKILRPFRLGFGGKVGTGRQFMSFVHIDDLLNAYKFVIDNEDCRGIFNLTSPQTITNKNFTDVLATALKRPAFFTVPSFILRMLYGQGALVLTKGQAAVPKRLKDKSFVFNHPEIVGAIEDLLQKDRIKKGH